ncbi:MAG TPA: type II toxin-antitoxin system VapC family toxin [Stackebrandtia sp.]|uniref:type II toxin-antitoxin system VapC family toxin n=1 Tax=Stackebrandtia sp. TaxID=2023065 RepID=UPI002D464DF1|nr:type II toxin-antitoxin system VapC family toxin [Stackebrandtia sp.]HZE41392.1 type II toxin-antitoxin system VapC family toxin [Stackebrandtia sp.]
MIVVDTSALVESLVGKDARALAVRTVMLDQTLAAPHGIDLEFAAALRGLAKGKKIHEKEAERACSLLGQMPIRRFEHTPLLRRIWQLRHNMWPYDVSFVALAELLDAPLVTVDKKFSTVPGLQCEVELISS